MKSFAMSKPSSLLSSLLFCAILPVTAEYRFFEIVMPPTEEYIHFTDGYIRGPGFIDISSLRFETLTETFIVEDDTPMNDDGDDHNGGPPRALQMITSSSSSSSPTQGQQTQLARRLDGGMEADAFVLDIAAFKLSDSCAKNPNCDWTQFGIGATAGNGALRWCCSQDAIDLGMCSADDMGRLILRSDVFEGEHRFISVPFSGDTTKKLRYGKFEEEDSGRYVVVFANCNVEGRNILVKGEAIWKSTHGYLPGELFGFMYFYILLTIIYAVLTSWFGFLMNANKDSRIPIEKWILMAMVMGLCEMFFRSSDYFLWNASGHRPSILVYSGIIVGVLKRGVSRVLLVMVSLGWGVIRDSLGSTMNPIIMLGASYIGVSAVRDLMMEFAIEDMTTLSYEREVQLFDAVTVLTFVVAAIDVIFILWYLDALNGTMQYLESNSQLRKLGRYLRLRTILLCSILFAVIWVVFSLVDNYDDDGIVAEEHAWIVDGATEVNYLFVLTCVAILWRPNPSAQDYAYVMELPASGGDDDGETEIELSGTVPSAVDDGLFDDDDKGNGHDQRFNIDEGESA